MKGYCEDHNCSFDPSVFKECPDCTWQREGAAIRARAKQDLRRRRETIATAVLAGMWANPKEWISSKPASVLAVEEADKLIAELDR